MTVLKGLPAGEDGKVVAMDPISSMRRHRILQVGSRHRKKIGRSCRGLRGGCRRWCAPHISHLAVTAHVLIPVVDLRIGKQQVMPLHLALDSFQHIDIPWTARLPNPIPVVLHHTRFEKHAEGKEEGRWASVCCMMSRSEVSACRPPQLSLLLNLVESAGRAREQRRQGPPLAPSWLQTVL